MATPTSHPRPSPQKPPNAPTAAQSHLTPPATTSAVSPLPFGSTHSSNSTRAHPSPLTTATPAKRPFTFGGNGHARGPSSGGQPMSRTGTNQSLSATPKTGAGAQGGQPMARTGTNQSMMSANTPTPGMVRSATNMTTGGTSGAGDSPAVSAAMGALMESLQQNGGKGLGLNMNGGMMTGLTPPAGMLGKTGLTPASLQGQQVGLRGGGQGFSSDQEREMKIMLIADMLGKRWGYVSQAGTESAAKRLGLECLWEEDMGNGKRGLSVAGQGLLVEVTFEGDEIRGLVLDFPGSKWAGEDEGQKKRGGEVLELCQKPEEDDDVGIVKLDKFADNLERLARMDKLSGSGEGKVNCFDAVEGVHRSLRLVYEKELESERRKEGRQFNQAVLCSRGGKPVMHEGERVGLSLQFWMDRRLNAELPDSEDAMNVDGDVKSGIESFHDQIWSAVIECEASPASLYTPVRVSEKWVLENTESSSGGSALQITDTNLNWLEPPGDLHSSGTEANGDHSPPDVRFVAKLEPPIVVPLAVAIQLHESLGSSIPQEHILPTTYDSLLFSLGDIPDPLQAGPPRTFEKTVRSYSSATDPYDGTPHQHKYNLYTMAQDFGRNLTDLPFRHPMQLNNLLPTLRQWALVGNILKRSLTTSPYSLPTSPSLTAADSENKVLSEPSSPVFESVEDELADFLASPLPGSTTTKTGEEAVKNIDVSFTATPFPQFQVQFAHTDPKHAGKMASVQFSIGLGGVVEVVDVEGGMDKELGLEAEVVVREKMRLREKVKRVLEIGEDLGVLVEWLAMQ